MEAGRHAHGSTGKAVKQTSGTRRNAQHPARAKYPQSRQSRPPIHSYIPGPARTWNGRTRLSQYIVLPTDRERHETGHRDARPTQHRHHETRFLVYTAKEERHYSCTTSRPYNCSNYQPGPGSNRPLVRLSLAINQSCFANFLGHCVEIIRQAPKTPRKQGRVLGESRTATVALDLEHNICGSSAALGE